MGNKKWYMYLLLLIVSGGFLLVMDSSRQTSVSASDILESGSYVFLASSLQECPKCDVSLFYRDAAEKDSCLITRVDSLLIKNREHYRVTKQTLQTFIDDKGDRPYLFPADQHALFEYFCYNFPEKVETIE